jgi:hypothetical protein
MKLTIFAAIIFVAGLWPGLAKYQGGVRPVEPPKHVLTTLKEAPTQPAPTLETLAEKLKLRL